MMIRLSGTYDARTDSAQRTSNPSARTPRAKLRADGRFVMHAIPGLWLSYWKDRKLSEHSLSGTWSPGGDGDGNWILNFQVSDEDGLASNRTFQMYVGTSPFEIYSSRFPEMKRASTADTRPQE